MTLHLRAIHSGENLRADVQASRHLRAGTTEQLRDELDNVRPLLRWPMRSRFTAERAAAIQTAPNRRN